MERYRNSGLARTAATTCSDSPIEASCRFAARLHRTASGVIPASSAVTGRRNALPREGLRDLLSACSLASF